MRMPAPPDAEGLEDDGRAFDGPADLATYLNGQLDMLVTVAILVEDLLAGLQTGVPPPQRGADVAELVAFQTDFVLRATDEVVRLQRELSLIADTVIEERRALSAGRRSVH
jgi:hypothetical protein